MPNFDNLPYSEVLLSDAGFNALRRAFYAELRQVADAIEEREDAALAECAALRQRAAKGTVTARDLTRALKRVTDLLQAQCDGNELTLAGLRWVWRVFGEQRLLANAVAADATAEHARATLKLFRAGQRRSADSTAGAMPGGRL